MMKFAADENFNGKVLTGLKSALSELDIVRVQDTEMYQASDPDLLAWTAQQDRILLTHDVQTITGYAYDRIRKGLAMPGVIEVRLSQGIGRAIEELITLIGAGTPSDFENQIWYVPL